MNTAHRVGVAALLLLALAGCERMRGPRPAPVADARITVDLVEVRRLASEAYARQAWPDAERYFVQLTTRLPEEPEPWFKLGNVYARTGRSELAVRAYREAVRRDPEHTRAWHNMAVVQLQQAAASLRELQKFAKPDDPLYQRGVELGEMIEAMLQPAGGGAP